MELLIQVQILNKVAFHFALTPFDKAWILLFSYLAIGKL